MPYIHSKQVTAIKDTPIAGFDLPNDRLTLIREGQRLGVIRKKAALNGNVLLHLAGEFTENNKTITQGYIDPEHWDLSSLETPIVLIPQPMASTVGVLTRKKKHDQWGGRLFSLRIAGNVYECVSGQPGHDPVPVEQDFPQSNNPLPEGRYRVGPTDIDMTQADRSQGIGPWWVYLTPLGNTNGRSNFGIHADYNWGVAPGSAGCICPTIERHIVEICALVDQGLFTELIVDHGFGTVDSSQVLHHQGDSDDQAGMAIGMATIAVAESFEGRAYPDPKSGREPWTIGWGFTWYADGSPVQPHDQMSREEGDRLLLQLIQAHYLPGQQSIPCWTKLNANQKGALLSFAWNLSSGQFYRAKGFKTITGALRNEQLADVPRAMMLYHEPREVNVRLGLSIRRRAEGLIWSGSEVSEAFKRARTEIKTYDDVQRFL